ncbi:hypothetical protein TCA2_4402 [Paenibacillus sp. TCA20]|nr:hypothetical protein TCA2_4402 [Paenibacillus sp. TCA20]
MKRGNRWALRDNLGVDEGCHDHTVCESAMIAYQGKHMTDNHEMRFDSDVVALQYDSLI